MLGAPQLDCERTYPSLCLRCSKFAASRYNLITVLRTKATIRFIHNAALSRRWSDDRAPYRIQTISTWSFTPIQRRLIINMRTTKDPVEDLAKALVDLCIDDMGLLIKQPPQVYVDPWNDKEDKFNRF